MRKLVTIIFLVLTTSSYGQKDSTSIYTQSLFYYNTYLDSLKSNNTEIIVESNTGITDNFPSQIGNRKVTILTGSNQKEIYQEHNNKIVLLKVYPAKINEDIIQIWFVPYSGEYKGKRKGYFLGYGNWIIILFKFDCTNKTFKYLNTVTGGI